MFDNFAMQDVALLTFYSMVKKIFRDHQNNHESTLESYIVHSHEFILIHLNWLC